MGLQSGKVSRQTKWNQKRLESRTTSNVNNNTSATVTAVTESDVVSRDVNEIDFEDVQFHNTEGANQNGKQVMIYF